MSQNQVVSTERPLKADTIATITKTDKAKSLVRHKTQDNKICGLPVGTNALGKGSYGAVYMTQDTVNNIMIPAALKVIDIAATDDNLIEPIIMKTIDHPNILKAYHLYDSKYCGANKIGYTIELGVRDLSPSKNTHRLLSSEAYLRPKFFNVACGIEFMHRWGFLHGDIKPANIIVFPNDSVKISDFGISFNLDTRPIVNKLIYSGWFRPPELYLNLPYFLADNKAATGIKVIPYANAFATDIWALGMTFCYLLIKEAVLNFQLPIELPNKTIITYTLIQLLDLADVVSPQQEMALRALNLIITNGSYLNNIINLCHDKIAGPDKLNTDKATQFAQLLAWMLEPNPQIRPTALQVCTHPYFSTPIMQSVFSAEGITMQSVGGSALVFNANIGLYNSIVYPSITTSDDVNRIKVTIDVLQRRMININGLLSEYLLAADIIYQSISVFKFNNPSLLIDAALLIVDDIVGRPGWTTNKTVTTVKRDIIFKLDGKVYRRHLHYYAKSVIDLARAYVITNEPEQYITLKTSQELLAWYAKDTGVISSKIANPNLDKYTVTVNNLVKDIIPVLVKLPSPQKLLPITQITVATANSKIPSPQRLLPIQQPTQMLLAASVAPELVRPKALSVTKPSAFRLPPMTFTSANKPSLSTRSITLQQLTNRLPLSTIPPLIPELSVIPSSTAVPPK